jgi:hypothetical protein
MEKIRSLCKWYDLYDIWQSYFSESSNKEAQVMEINGPSFPNTLFVLEIDNSSHFSNRQIDS